MEKLFTCSQCNNLLDAAFQSYSRPGLCCFCKKRNDETTFTCQSWCEKVFPIAELTQDPILKGENFCLLCAAQGQLDDAQDYKERSVAQELIEEIKNNRKKLGL